MDEHINNLFSFFFSFFRLIMLSSPRGVIVSSLHSALEVVEQHVKEEAILNFIYEDKSDRLERILLTAGVAEEQYVQFPVDDHSLSSV